MCRICECSLLAPGGSVWCYGRPEQDSEDHDDGGRGDQLSTEFRTRICGSMACAQDGRVPGRGSCNSGSSATCDWASCAVEARARLGVTACGLRCGGGTGRRGWFGLPGSLGLQLRLADTLEIFGDGFFGVESEMLGVGADESFIEDAAGKLIEVFLLDRLEHARTDLDDVGNVIEREFFRLARLAKFFSECAHADLAKDVGNMIGQAVCARYGQERRRGNFRGFRLYGSLTTERHRGSPGNSPADLICSD